MDIRILCRIHMVMMHVVFLTQNAVAIKSEKRRAQLADGVIYFRILGKYDTMNGVMRGNK